MVLTSTKVDRGFESQSGQIKNYKIGICNCSAKYAALEIESGILIMCPSGGDVYIRGLVQGASTMKIVDLVQSGPHHHLIENLKFKGLFSNTLKRSDVIN